MQQTIDLNTAIETLLLKVDSKEYTLCLPRSAVAEAEKAIGKDLRYLPDFYNLAHGDVPAVLEAGLRKYHPAGAHISMRDMCEGLTPEGMQEIRYALCKLTFPEAVARLEAVAAESKAS